MSKETIMSVLEELIETTLGNFDLSLEWSSSKQSIEITLALFAENKEKLSFSDTEEVESDETVLEFVDSVVLFNEKRGKVVKENHLFALPFEDKKGIQKAYLQALIETLQEVLSTGQDNFFAFLEDNKTLLQIEKMNDEEIKAYFTSLNNEEQEHFLHLLDEEPAFSLVWQEDFFTKEVEKYLAMEEGKMWVMPPKF